MADETSAGDGPPSPQRRKPAQHPLVRSGFIEYDRVIFFSDAVFAIAITLLAVNLRVPRVGNIGSAHELRQAVPGIFGFAISFAVIAFFWVGHHAIFRYITAIDRPLIGLNLVFLGTIAFLPYPTDLLSASSSAQPPAVIFYAACCALAGLGEAAVWLYATHAPVSLTDPSAEPVRTFYLLRMLRVPAVFIVSIPVAVVAPKDAPYMWLLIWISGAVLNHFWKPPASPESID